jgi:uncharacterized membrane protein YkvA (DUF1232 family)
MKPGFEKLRQGSRRLKQNSDALFLAYRDPRVPWYAKAFAACVVAYAFSPLDLVPDFIPVLGYLDDLILVPLGIALALRMIPPEVMAESRMRAAERLEQDRPRSWVAGAVVVAIWLVLAAVAIFLVVRLLLH